MVRPAPPRESTQIDPMPRTAAASSSGWLPQRGPWLSYSVGMTITEQIHQAVLKAPATAWTAAIEPSGEIRDGAWVAGLSGDCLKGWPKGMRLIVRKERPHPRRPVADHRRRWTAADLVRHQHHRHADRGTGATTPPAGAGRGPHPGRADPRPAQPAPARHRAEPDLAGDRPARPGPAGLDADARSERRNAQAGAPPSPVPPSLRRRPDFVTTARRRYLRFARHWPWTGVITDALARLEALPNPG